MSTSKSKKKAREHFQMICDKNSYERTKVKLNSINKAYMFCPSCGKKKFFYYIYCGKHNEIEYNFYCAKCDDAFVIVSRGGFC